MKYIFLVFSLFLGTSLYSQSDTISWKVIELSDSLAQTGYGTFSGPQETRSWNDSWSRNIMVGKISTALGSIDLSKPDTIKPKNEVSFQCTSCSICDEKGPVTIIVTSDSPITISCSTTKTIDTLRYDYYWFSENTYKQRIKMQGTIGMSIRSDGQTVLNYNWFEFIDGVPFTHMSAVENCSERSYIYDLKLVAKLPKGTGSITKFK